MGGKRTLDFRMATQDDAGGDVSQLAPLFDAIAANNVAVVGQYLDNGFNPNLKDENSTGLLQLAVEYGHLELVKFLLERGARTEDRDQNQATALHSAAKVGDLQLVSQLVQAGAKIEARDKDEARPLHWACQSGNGNI